MRTPYETLKETALFSGLTWEQARALVERSTLQKLHDDQRVIRAGEVGQDSMWVILEGNVEVRVGDTVIAIYGEGAYIGELALLGGPETPRTADAVTRGATALIEIKRSDLVALVNEDPEAALSIMAELARRLRHTTLLLAGSEGQDHAAEHLGPIEAR